jgi:hypothetical protein
MAKTRKRIRMTVEVSCPAWLTAAQARREVRALINHQAFWGQSNPTGWDQVDDHNFRAMKVGAAKP